LEVVVVVLTEEVVQLELVQMEVQAAAAEVLEVLVIQEELELQVKVIMAAIHQVQATMLVVEAEQVLMELMELMVFLLQGVLVYNLLLLEQLLIMQVVQVEEHKALQVVQVVQEEEVEAEVLHHTL
tara:strand:+ start:285 stop:662 length:378 start_codon:yes stop_codon:yes gene_type:complete